MFESPVPDATIAKRKACNDKQQGLTNQSFMYRKKHILYCCVVRGLRNTDNHFIGLPFVRMTSRQASFT